MTNKGTPAELILLNDKISRKKSAIETMCNMVKRIRAEVAELEQEYETIENEWLFGKEED